MNIECCRWRDGPADVERLLAGGAADLVFIRVLTLVAGVARLSRSRRPGRIQGRVSIPERDRIHRKSRSSVERYHRRSVPPWMESLLIPG
jgi:hypothetical protein